MENQFSNFDVTYIHVNMAATYINSEESVLDQLYCDIMYLVSSHTVFLRA